PPSMTSLRSMGSAWSSISIHWTSATCTRSWQTLRLFEWTVTAGLPAPPDEKESLPMKRLALLIVVLACWSIPAFAADVPFSEVFGGFSFNHRANANNSLTYTGWQANAAFNVHEKIGVVADFAGEY